MKSFIKSLLLTLLITAPAFAAQQQAEQKQDASQAQLDALQYAKEQESKKIAAAANKNNLALQSLGNPRLQAILGSLNGVLPNDVAQIIAEYDDEDFENGHQLWPAILPDRFKDIPRPTIVFHFEGKMISPSKYELQLKRPAAEAHLQELYTWHYTPQQPLPTRSISGKFIDGRLYLDSCREKEQLRSLDAASIAYIRWLYQENKKIAYPGLRIFISQEQENIHDALPANMQAFLEHNYNIVTKRHNSRQLAPYLVWAASAASVGAVFVAGISWLLNK